MSEPERVKEYERAIRLFQQHLSRADDGTFRLDIEDGLTIGVDPVVFADLKRSLDQTNTQIRRGEIDPSDVAFI